MTHDDLRGKALRAIDEVYWHPHKGRARIEAMVRERPDWCLSRQRRWGVPLAIFQRDDDGSLLQDEATERRIIDAFKDEGADAWFKGDPKRFLAPEHLGQYEPVMDILDVWFDSGCSHSFVLGDKQAHLYVEGSDQHRGWFQSSLLHSCGKDKDKRAPYKNGRAPYKNVLTHGFVLDDKGYKMSKSQGNVLTPQQIMAEHGTDVLRLWVALSDTSEDMKMGQHSLAHAKDHYRRFRNCLRFLLGVLHYHDDSMKLPLFEKLEIPEQALLDGLVWGDAQHERCFQYPDGFNFNQFYNWLHRFCAEDLSAFYLKIRKDCLYCDDKNSPKRRASLAVLALVFDYLCRWLAPVLVFTTDEAWKHRYGQDSDIHCHDFDTHPLPSLEENRHRLKEEPYQVYTMHAINLIDTIRKVMDDVERKLEHKRDEITTNSQAELVCYADEYTTNLLKDINMRELTMTASFEVRKDPNIQRENTTETREVKGFKYLTKYSSTMADTEVYYRLTSNPKCLRCWRYEPQDEPRLKDKGICARCYEVCYG